MAGNSHTLSGTNVVTGSSSPNSIGDMEMTELPQLSRLEVQELNKKDPSLVEKARVAGQLEDLLGGNDPGACPTCKRAFQEAK